MKLITVYLNSDKYKNESFLVPDVFTRDQIHVIVDKKYKKDGWYSYDIFNDDDDINELIYDRNDEINCDTVVILSLSEIDHFKMKYFLVNKNVEKLGIRRMVDRKFDRNWVRFDTYPLSNYKLVRIWKSDDDYIRNKYVFIANKLISDSLIGKHLPDYDGYEIIEIITDDSDVNVGKITLSSSEFEKMKDVLKFTAKDDSIDEEGSYFQYYYIEGDNNYYKVKFNIFND